MQGFISAYNESSSTTLALVVDSSMLAKWSLCHCCKRRVLSLSGSNKRFQYRRKMGSPGRIRARAGIAVEGASVDTVAAPRPEGVPASSTSSSSNTSGRAKCALNLPPLPNDEVMIPTCPDRVCTRKPINWLMSVSFLNSDLPIIVTPLNSPESSKRSTTPCFVFT